MGQQRRVASAPVSTNLQQVRHAHRTLPKPRPRVKINLDGELNVNTSTLWPTIGPVSLDVHTPKSIASLGLR